jgi:hypothetical protein
MYTLHIKRDDGSEAVCRIDQGTVMKLNDRLTTRRYPDKRWESKHVMQVGIMEIGNLISSSIPHKEQGILRCDNGSSKYVTQSRVDEKTRTIIITDSER